MKFGIIGAGMIGQYHAKAIEAMDGSSLQSVFDLRQESADRLAGPNGATGYCDIDAFLADPELDIVTIGTPSGAHLDPALAALKAGKHVICEKPLEITTARIDEMVEVAAANNCVLSAVLNRRFHPGMEAFKKAVDEGRFGQLTSASAYIKWYRTQEYYDSGAWRGTWKLDGGGALMNQSIHTIDALIYLAGPVKSVIANTACVAHTDIEVEDIAVAILEFENGARGVVEGSTATWSKNGHPARVQLAGTEGSVFLADESFELWEFMNETPADDEIRNTLMAGAGAGVGANDPNAISFYQHQLNFEEVVAAIQEGREPTTSASEARKAVEVITAIYESAQNGGKQVLLG